MFSLSTVSCWRSINSISYPGAMIRAAPQRQEAIRFPQLHARNTDLNLINFYYFSPALLDEGSYQRILSMPYAYIEIFEHLCAALWLLPSTAWEKKKTEILIHARSTIKCQGLCRFKCTLNSEMVPDMNKADLGQVLHGSFL